MCAQFCPTFGEHMDGSSPGSSVHGISQARILEWAAIPFPGDLPNSGIEPMSLASPALAGGFFTTEPPEKPQERATSPINLQVSKRWAADSEKHD